MAIVGSLVISLDGTPTADTDTLVRDLVAKIERALASDATLTAAFTTAGLTRPDGVAFTTTAVQPEQEAMRATAVTPSDTVNLARTASAVWAAGAGNITYLDAQGRTKGATVAANGRVSDLVSRVLATGTTATGLVALSRRANGTL